MNTDANWSKVLILEGSLENHSMACPPRILGNSHIKYVVSWTNSILWVQNCLRWSCGSDVPKYLSYFRICTFCGKGVKVMFLSKGRGHTFSRLNYGGFIFPLFILSIFICWSCSFCVTMSRGDFSLSHFKLVTSKFDGNFAPYCANTSI